MDNNDESRFFKFGNVSLEERDFKSRQACIRICMPCCLFQTVTPILLGSGIIDEFKIMEPLAAWIPTLSDDRINAITKHTLDNAEIRINQVLGQETERLLAIFSNMAKLVNNASDLVPMLPLGVYITFRFRCNMDRVINIIDGLQSINVDGVHEFQWSLATVLSYVVQEFSKWEMRVISQ